MAQHMTPFASDDFANIDREAYVAAVEADDHVPLSYIKDVWQRLKVNSLAVSGLVIILLLILVAIFGPSLTRYSYSDQNLNLTSIPPFLKIRELGDGTSIYIHPTLKVIHLDARGELTGVIPIASKDLVNKTSTFIYNGDEYVIDFKEQPFTVTNSQGMQIPIAKTIWNRTYRFGSDHLGRDVLTRVIYGARISLIIGFVASLVNLTIGVFYGGIAGYMGGMTDNVMMRIVDTMRSIPRLLYVIIIMVIIGSGLKTVVLTIGLVYWLGMARIVRGQVLSLKNHEFVMAARTMGARSGRILTKYLVPNALGPIIVVTAMNIPGAIFTEAFLSFVGLGVSAPQASWGTLCNDALSGFQRYPYQLFFPAFAICLTVLAFNFVGDGLRDSLDPRLRK